MNLKFSIFILVLVIPFAYADFGKANQESVEVRIDSFGDVKVKHVIKNSDSPQQLKLVDGVTTNISAFDENNNTITLTILDDGYVLISPSKEDVIVEYDLEDELVQIDGVWTMDFNYEMTTAFLVPDVDMIYANGKPIYLGEKKGIACHGCFMLLEFIINEPRVFANVKWEEEEFLVEVRTRADVKDFEFSQSMKSIKFDVEDSNEFVTAIIPTKLLGEPYSVFLDDEKIYFHEYINNGTHAWVNARPDSTGEIEIIGTTVIPEFSLMIPLIMGFVGIVLFSKFACRNV